VSEAEILEQGKTTAIKWHPIMFHFYIHANQQSLLQKSFVVSVSNLFSISASLADTIYTILKIAYFLYQMLPTDTKNRFFLKRNNQARPRPVGPNPSHADTPARRRAERRPSLRLDPCPSPLARHGPSRA
jgi:hypothetical protein